MPNGAELLRFILSLLGLSCWLFLEFFKNSIKTDKRNDKSPNAKDECHALRIKNCGILFRRCELVCFDCASGDCIIRLF